jgi:hypothetical protein
MIVELRLLIFEVKSWRSSGFLLRGSQKTCPLGNSPAANNGGLGNFRVGMVLAEIS